jgi:hypothetical protein
MPSQALRRLCRATRRGLVIVPSLDFRADKYWERAQGAQEWSWDTEEASEMTLCPWLQARLGLPRTSL